MKKNGFTIIELMIVVAIIGILAAVIIPLFTNPVSKDGSICKYGMKYSTSGAQIISATGGGIPCETISTPTTSFK